MARYSLFDHSTTPELSLTDVGADVNENLGIVFESSRNGHLTSIWLYIGNTTIGGADSSVILYPYAPVGDTAPAIATQNFTFQSTVGWQEIVLTDPVAITGNTRYIAVYHTPTGNYVFNPDQFDNDLVSGVLTAPAGGGNDNGRFRTDAVNFYPTSGSPNNGWYGIDVTVEATLNPLPVAAAGSNQHVPGGQTVTLDGSASSATGGTISNYLWLQTSGRPTSLSDVTAARPTFTAPPMDANDEPLIYTLTVTDTSGGVSTPDAVTITIAGAPQRNIRVASSWQPLPVQSWVNNNWAPRITPPGATITHGEQLTYDIVGLRGLGVEASDLEPVIINSFRISTYSDYGLPPWIPNQAYTYDNNPSNHGGIVPSGGLTIDGFFVPEGVWVSQFQNYDTGLYIEGDQGSPWPGMLFRGCRWRGAITAPGFLNDVGNDTQSGKIWVLFCDTGGLGAADAQYNEVPLKLVQTAGIFYRNYVSYVTTGIQALVNGSDILENYIEKLTYYYGPNPPPGESTDKHLNGVTFNGSQTCARVERNYIVMQTPDDAGRVINQTDCISFFQDGGAFPGNGTNDDSTVGYRVLDNYVGGGSYCIYAGQNSGTPPDSVQNMVITGNKFTTQWWPDGGVFGPAGSVPTWGSFGNVWNNNTWADGPNAGQAI